MAGATLSCRAGGSLTVNGSVYCDVHVHDRVGLPVLLARHAYGQADLVRDLEALEARGAGIMAVGEWNLACELHRLECAIDERLAEDIASGRLIGLHRAVGTADPWSEKREVSFSCFDRIKLPAPLPPPNLPPIPNPKGQDETHRAITELCQRLMAELPTAPDDWRRKAWWSRALKHAPWLKEHTFEKAVLPVLRHRKPSIGKGGRARLKLGDGHHQEDPKANR